MEYISDDFEALDLEDKDDDLEYEDDDLEYEDNDFNYESTSLNSATLADIKDVLYALHEYFDQFEIAVVACPCLTKEPYNLGFSGLSGNMYIEEMKSPLDMLYTISASEAGPMRSIPFRSNLNFFSDGKPGMVLKIHAKGRKTNYSIITLIQNILNKRFSYKMGLGGVLLIKGGQVVVHVAPNYLNEQYLNCDPVQIAISTIVNNPILEQQKDGLPDYCNIDTNNRYMSHIFFQNEHGLFVNDVTPNQTEYVGYFNVAEKVIITIG